MGRRALWAVRIRYDAPDDGDRAFNAWASLAICSRSHTTAEMRLMTDLSGGRHRDLLQALQGGSAYGYHVRTNGARGRSRTADTAIFSRMLYQLSYPGTGLFAGAIVRGGVRYKHDAASLSTPMMRMLAENVTRPLAGAVRAGKGKAVSCDARGGHGRPQMAEDRPGMWRGLAASVPERLPASQMAVEFALSARREATRAYGRINRPVAPAYPHPLRGGRAGDSLRPAS